MEDRKKILERLRADLQRDKTIDENLESYNRHNKMIILLAKLGLVLHKSIPYIVSILIVLSYYQNKGVFSEKTKTVYANMQSVVTSSGLSHSSSSFDVSFSGTDFFHTTGWSINPENGLWIRYETDYSTRLPDDMDLKDYEAIFELSKEEIEGLVKITDFKVIEKKYLSDEDHLYDEEALVVKFTTDDLSNYRIEPLNWMDVSLRAFLFLVLSTVIGGGMRVVVKKVFKDFGIPGKLKEVELSHKVISKAEREEMIKLLKLRETSLSLLDDDAKSITADGSKVYSLTYQKVKR